jgi:hypothetical protein
MKTKEQILDAVKNGRESNCIDGRDYDRLSCCFEEKDLELFGFKVNDGIKWIPKEYTKENILQQLKLDVDFGFEKALNKRGLSSSLMYEVVKMWMWVLDDELMNFDNYSMYGLPLFKAVAIKYGFDNPIGNDSGSEDKYNE